MNLRFLSHRHFLIFNLFCFTVLSAFGQPSGKRDDVFIDNKGVMRWGNSKEEVKGF